MSKEIVVSMQHMNKSFHGVPAVDDVSLEILKGEVHALCGENGAGKSTLMKMLAGIYPADGGTIYIDGQLADITDPLSARRYGISFMHQEICLAENLSVAENIYLGVELTKRGFLDDEVMALKVQNILDEMDMPFSANDKVGKLSLGQQQMAELARCIFFDAKVIIMDEPTSSLSDKEVRTLFQQVKKLRERGTAVIYISHRMEEIFEITDRTTVMRDGKNAGTVETETTNTQEIVSMMVGREIGDLFGVEHVSGTDTILSVRNFSNRKIKDVSFDLKRGEILGFAGLVGAGRTETALAIYGIDPLETGELYLEGKQITVNSPKEALKNGIVLVPEDRKRYGLVLSRSVGFNLTLPILRKFIHFIHLDRKKELSLIEEYSRVLAIKMAHPDQECAGLSGGNQQKVVIAKWLASEPKVIIMDEPTRGIDVGAKKEIYNIMTELAKNGYGIIMISSDLPEVMHISSRIAVMHEGRLMTVLDNKNRDVSQETIMQYAIGG